MISMGFSIKKETKYTKEKQYNKKFRNGLRIFTGKQHLPRKFKYTQKSMNTEDYL